jgi:hypothetical protein
MNKHNLFSVGGLFAILLGLTKVWTGISYLTIPADQRAAMPGKVFLPAYAQGHGLLNSLFWAEALVGVFGLAIVPALAKWLVDQRNEGWVKWTGTLATVGYAVSAIGYFLTLARLPGIATAFVNGDPSTQAALAVTWKSTPDLFGFWGYGAIGIWVLCMSLLMLQRADISKVFAGIGVFTAALSLLVAVGTYFKLQPLLLIAAGAGGIAAPVWFIWLGVLLRRGPKAVMDAREVIQPVEP